MKVTILDLIQKFPDQSQILCGESLVLVAKVLFIFICTIYTVLPCYVEYGYQGQGHS